MNSFVTLKKAILFIIEPICSPPTVPLPMDPAMYVVMITVESYSLTNVSITIILFGLMQPVCLFVYCISLNRMHTLNRMCPWIEYVVNLM